MNENANKDWAQSVFEVAKHSSLSFSLSGWPAAAVLISIPTSAVLIYAIKTFSSQA